MDHPFPRLRYIDASKVNDATLDLDSLDVRNPDGEPLGTVEGLVVDVEAQRPVYVVVDAGGWFKARLFLLPIGEVHLDGTRQALVASISKAQVDGFPGFDSSEFEKLSEDDILRINGAIGHVYEPGAVYSPDEPYSAAWERNPYRLPDWWDSDAATMRRLLEVEAVDVGARAQPGDVLGIESDGAQTHVGDSEEDERERRRAALAEAGRH